MRYNAPEIEDMYQSTANTDDSSMYIFQAISNAFGLLLLLFYKEPPKKRRQSVRKSLPKKEKSSQKKWGIVLLAAAVIAAVVFIPNKWTDIVAVSAGGYHTVGLKSDGTVVAV